MLDNTCGNKLFSFYITQIYRVEVLKHSVQWGRSGETCQNLTKNHSKKGCRNRSKFHQMPSQDERGGKLLETT